MDMPNSTFEEWRPVTNYAGIYEVSSLGRVRSIDRAITTKNGQTRRYSGKVLKFGFHEFGYPKVNLLNAGDLNCSFVHRLVCEAFHGKQPSPEHEVAHNDGNPKNCRKENLRWDLPKGNQSDRRVHGTALTKDDHPSAKLTSEKVNEIKKRLKHGESQYKIADDFGVSRGTIQAIHNGKTWRD